jgi:hypothetical protein
MRDAQIRASPLPLQYGEGNVACNTNVVNLCGMHRLELHENALTIFWDMEGITENGGFRFRRLHRKVLSFRWDTEKDEISVEVKIDYSKKKKRS